MPQHGAQEWVDGQRRAQESSYRTLARLWNARRDDGHDPLDGGRTWARLAGREIADQPCCAPGALREE